MLSALLTSQAASQPTEAQLMGLLAQLGVAFHDEGAQELWVLLVHGMSFRDGRRPLLRSLVGICGASAARSKARSGSAVQAALPTAHRLGAPRVEFASSVMSIIGGTSHRFRRSSWRSHDAAHHRPDTNEFRRPNVQHS